MTNADMPAMPQSIAMNETEIQSLPSYKGNFNYSGFTKREELSARFMAAMIAGYSSQGVSISHNKAANAANSQADALLKSWVAG